MSAVLERTDEIRGLDRLPPDALYEVIDGEAKEIPHLGFAANQVAVQFVIKLDQAKSNPRDLVTMESLFDLPIAERRRRRPDVAYVPAERVPGSWPPPFGIDPPAIEAVPSITVEVISPTDLANEVEEKRRDYFAAGVELVLLVFPMTQTIHVWRTSHDCQILSTGDVLELGNRLPAFSVRVAEFFAPLNRPS